MDYNRPTLDNSLAFDIKGARHPVVEAALAKQNETFVPNDCNLANDDRLWLLTGPNMAGKSTYLRQNALIAILAQIGSFVPAASAHIGLIDRVFSRVGASDDLARGRSTFMVEMVETATILNQSTDRSLVILDEIGRGTATFDGLSIAWACVEHLHETNKCRSLFATHYHELTALTAKLDALSCHSMQVKEWKGDIIFMHTVGEGAADRSYGIHVAKIAGLPDAVINRAGEVLALLQSGEKSNALQKLADDLPLFSSSAPTAAAPQNNPLTERLETINPDSLSPKEALDLLYELKSLYSSHN
jgi:DNA mismatch repair protein MutS